MGALAKAIISIVAAMHIWPHIDEILCLLMALDYRELTKSKLGWEIARQGLNLLFEREGKKLSARYRELKGQNRLIGFGIGNASDDFNEHNDSDRGREDTSASMKLAQATGLDRDPDFRHILMAVLFNDRDGAGGQWGIGKLIMAIHKFSGSSMPGVNFGLDACRAFIAEAMRRRINPAAEKALDEALELAGNLMSQLIHAWEKSVAADDKEFLGQIGRELKVKKGFGFGHLVRALFKWDEKKAEELIPLVLDAKYAEHHEYQKALRAVQWSWKQLNHVPQADSTEARANIQRMKRWMLKLGGRDVTVVLATTKSYEMLNALRRGTPADIFIVRRPSGNFVIGTKYESNLDLQPVTEALFVAEARKRGVNVKELRDAGVFYYAGSKMNLLMNGGLTAPDVSASILTDEEVAEAIYKSVEVARPAAKKD